MRTRVFTRGDFSMGLQNATSWLSRKPNELDDGRNLRFNEEIGAIWRRNGYIKKGLRFSTTSKLPTGMHTAQFTTGSRRFVACNSDDSTATLVRVQETDGSWTTIINDLPPNADVYFCDFRDEVYVSGYTTADNKPFQPRNIDKTLNVSTTRNLLFAPWCKYFVVYRGILHAANVLINTTDRYPDRFYKASAPVGAITFVRGAQIDPLAPVTLINQVPVMTSNTSPSGTVFASDSPPETNPEAPFRAFDQNINTRALFGNFNESTGVGSGILRYDFGSGVTKAIAYYSINGFRSNDGGPIPARVPKDWTLEASLDGLTWTVLDTKTNQNWLSSETRTYSIPNTTAYRYYRLNITKNQSGTNGNQTHVTEFGLFTSLEGTKNLQLKIDSARYIKPGMALEIWKAGKNQKLYSLTVGDVDKPNNTITFVPENYTLGTVNTTADTITITSTANMPTGTPIIFSSTGSLPAPLVIGQTYYVINSSATTFKVANSLNAAMIGTAIDLTNTGSGIHTVQLSYVVANNDEFYLAGRHDVLTTFWNTDYPTPDKADWSAVQPGADSSNEITGVIESGNRLFLMTLNGSSRFDGTGIQVVSKTIGCASQRTLKTMDDDWMVWLTARGRVMARNEGASQQEYISRGVANKFFDKIPLNQLKSAAAGVTDGEYTVYVGNFDGEPSRALYDFGSNTWSIDSLSHSTLMYSNDTSDGYLKPFFVSANGYLYQDDTGDEDDEKAIVFRADFGKNNYGTENDKTYQGNYIYSENAAGVKISVRIDNGEPILVGELAKDYGQIDYPANGDISKYRGSTISIRLTSAIKGPAQRIYAVHDYFNLVQEISGNGTKQ